PRAPGHFAGQSEEPRDILPLRDAPELQRPPGMLAEEPDTPLDVVPVFGVEPRQISLEGVRQLGEELIARLADMQEEPVLDNGRLPDVTPAEASHIEPLDIYCVNIFKIFNQKG